MKKLKKLQQINKHLNSRTTPSCHNLLLKRNGSGSSAQKNFLEVKLARKFLRYRNRGLPSFSFPSSIHRDYTAIIQQCRGGTSQSSLAKCGTSCPNPSKKYIGSGNSLIRIGMTVNIWRSAWKMAARPLMTYLFIIAKKIRILRSSRELISKLIKLIKLLTKLVKMRKTACNLIKWFLAKKCKKVLKSQQRLGRRRKLVKT